MAEITYICKRTLVSTRPVQPGMQYPLQPLDMTMEHNRVHIVFYYKSKPHGCNHLKPGQATDVLIESFSEMLTSYPVVTGRLVRDDGGKWIVKCNDAGVRMVEARAKGSVEKWLEEVDSEKELKLVHWEEMHYKPYFWSTFYVQVTEFEGGGLALGLSCIHLLADPICLTMLVKSWIDTSLTGKVCLSPIFDPLPIDKNVDSNKPGSSSSSTVIKHYKSSIHTSVPVITAKHATITLSFSDQMVRSCIAKASLGCEGIAAHDSGLSPFEALCGLLWFCISRAKGVKEGLMNMSIWVDMREKFQLDRDRHFGNYMVYNKVDAKTGLTESRLLKEAGKSIQDAVTNISTNEVKSLISWLEANPGQYHPSMSECDLICSDLAGVDGRYLSFSEDGSEVPIRVSCYVEPVYGAGQVLILPSLRGEGEMSRVAMVTLLEDEIVRLVEDGIMKEISPTVVMGLKKVHVSP